MHLILASASPRRAELLRAAGFDFTVDPQDVDESVHPHESPGDYVLRVACEKVRRACRKSGGLVLAADTTVVVDGEILGKPGGPAEAARMLEKLSGREHEVLTGVAVRDGEREVSAVVTTRVRFLPLLPADIAWYVSSGEPMGKAGGYAIQGLASRFVEGIDGSYTNVVGLPIATVSGLLRALGRLGSGAGGWPPTGARVTV